MDRHSPSFPSPTISSCTIVKNEAHNIEGLLATLALFADEIVIFDTGSTDGTVALLQEKAATLSIPVVLGSYLHEPFHYGKAKNATLRAATKDYCVIVDADFRMGEGFVDGIRTFLQEKNPDLASYRIIDEYVPSLVVTPPFIIKRSAGHFYREDTQGRVHEEFEGIKEIPIIPFSGAMYHCQREDHTLVNPQRIFFQLRLEVERTPRTGSFFRHAIHACTGFWYKFNQYYFKRGCWHDGWAGFKYCFIKGLSEFLKHIFVGLKARPQDIMSLNERSPLQKGTAANHQTHQ